MRKALLLISCINFVALGVDEIFYGLLDLTKHPQLNLFDKIIKPFTLASLFISMILLMIYIIRQISAQDQQLRKQGRKNTSSKNILRMKSQKIRPYKREALLQKALFLSFPIFGLIRPVADLMFPYTTASSKPVILLHWVSILGIHLCLLIYALLSKDLAHQARQQGIHTHHHIESPTAHIPLKSQR